MQVGNKQYYKHFNLEKGTIEMRRSDCLLDHKCTYLKCETCPITFSSKLHGQCIAYEGLKVEGNDNTICSLFTKLDREDNIDMEDNRPARCGICFNFGSQHKIITLTIRIRKGYKHILQLFLREENNKYFLEEIK